MCHLPFNPGVNVNLTFNEGISAIFSDRGTSELFYCLITVYMNSLIPKNQPLCPYTFYFCVLFEPAHEPDQIVDSRECWSLLDQKSDPIVDVLASAYLCVHRVVTGLGEETSVLHLRSSEQ